MTHEISHIARRAPELLAPAGGPEPFAAALAAGADAIYLGMGSFNARRKADNFDDTSFEQACQLAHLAGARVYVTVNIVIKQREMGDALELVRRCAMLGADAFIIQDWGLFAEIRRRMPSIETHISTQANIHDARGTAWCRARGADRVTLSRELSIPEIARIHEAVDIDLEVFAHGSICFSYSGVCLLSSFACAGRSANRGMCAQPCRLPYELIDETGRVLSSPDRARALCPRDTNTTSLLPQLIEAGAGALKLEGRMKAPDYVYAVTDIYRRELDDILAGHKSTAEEQARRARQLKRCFNRDFTCAYQLGTSGDEMMSYERSNNRGQIVGEVVGFNARRAPTKGQAMRDAARGAKGTALIHLTEPVGAGDLLELRHDREPDRFLTGIARNAAAAGETIGIEVARPMPAGCTVRLIRSQRALDVAAEAISRAYPRKRAVDVHVVARLGEPFTVTLTCTDNPSLTAHAEGFVVEAARTRPVTRDDLVKHVGRMGSSPFEAASFAVELDEGCGMGFSTVHKVRTAACDALEAIILAPYRRHARALGEIELAPRLDAELSHADGPSTATEQRPCICAIATSLEAYEAARDAQADRIYMSTDHLVQADINLGRSVELGIIPLLDEVCRADDHDHLDAWITSGLTIAVGNISELALAAERGCSAEIRSCIPVHNAACLRFLEAHGAQGFWLSPELTLDEMEAFVPAATAPVGIMVYGRSRVMTSEHCMLQVLDACIHDCTRCTLRTRELSLRNIDGKVFPVRTDIHGRSRLYTAQPIDIMPQIPQLLGAGVSRFLVDGTLLEPEELRRQVLRARRALDAALAGRAPAARQRGCTSGCLFVGVD